MNQQLKITLPLNTIEKLNQIVAPENVNIFIDEAVNFYIKEINKKNLAQQLKEGAIKRAQRDLDLVV